MATLIPEIAALIDKKSAPILIVTENEEELALLEKLLQKDGYAILTARNVREAEDKLRNNNISILLAFHKQNGSSGLHLLSKAKEIKPWTCRILAGNCPLPQYLLKEAHPLFFIESTDNEKLLEQIAVCFETFQLQKENQLMQKILHKHHDELQKAEKKLIAHQELSGKIQKALLIDRAPKNLEGVSIATDSSASKEIDSDFIAFYRPVPHVLDVVLGDVMGKGLASTLIATAIKDEISRYANPSNPRVYRFDHIEFWREDIQSIRDILNQVHNSFYERLVSLEFYATLIFGRLDLEKRTFTFIDCGFTRPLYFRKAKRKATFINAPNFPIGTVQFPSYNPFEISYEKGDFILLYSDGVTEAKNAQGELFGEDRLANLVEEHAHLQSEEIARIITSNIHSFTGQENVDDDLIFVLLKIDDLPLRNTRESKPAKFGSALSQLQAAREWIREVCSKAPGDRERLSGELQLALDEIFTNIVIHGYEEKPGQPITLIANFEPDYISIETLDQGRPFSPEELPALNLCGEMEHGYGWYMIKKIADEVVYIPKQAKGGWNRLCLKKRYHNKGIHMELSHYEKEGAFVIRLDFESLDAKKVPEFKDKVIQLLNEQNNETVIFDLHKLQFIDSSGLGAFLSLMRQLNTRGAHLALVSLSKPVKTIFELVSMQKIFECFDTIENAIRGHAKK